MQDFDFPAFLDKYGISLSDIPGPSGNDELDDLSNILYYSSQETPRQVIPQLTELIKKHPEETALKNFLYVAYAKSGQQILAHKTLEATMRRHPNYLFGPVNYMLSRPEKSWIIAHGAKLGRNLSITDWPAREDGSYHITEFLAFERAAIIYLTYRGEMHAAKDRINRLLELGFEEDDLDFCIKTYQQEMLTRVTSRSETARQLRIQPIGHVSVSATAADRVYTLHHPELEEYFDCDLDDMTEKELTKIMALPRTTLVADLRQLLRAALASYLEMGGNNDDELEEEAESYWDITAIHALFLIGGLEATEALPEVLDFLRADEGTCDYFFGDFPQLYFTPTLFALTKHKPDVLAEYLREPHNYYYDRVQVTDTLAQIALHFPDQREEVVTIFRELWQQLLDHPGGNGLLDTELLSGMVANAVDMRATELMPLAQQIDDRGWINEDLVGSFSDLAKECELPIDPAQIEPQPANPFEYYNQTYRKRKAKTNNSSLLEMNQTPLDLILQKRMMRMLSSMRSGGLMPISSAPSPTTQKKLEVRTEEKVGRNSPCPCGSGRKYKQCCLRG